MVANRLEDLGAAENHAATSLTSKALTSFSRPQTTSTMPSKRSLNVARGLNVRRFAVVGHRAMSKGKLPLNDLAGAGGRMDVVVRALMAGLLTSHGLRSNTEVVLHLMGGPGPPRRIKFDGRELKGLHADERSIAGTVGKVIATPLPPIGHWQPITAGITHSGGDLNNPA